MNEETPLCSERSSPGKELQDKSWHVAVITAIANFVAVATLKSSGVIFVEVRTMFNITRETAAWPTSAYGAALHSAGIFVRLLEGRISMVRIMVIGSMLIWIGLIASAFTSSIIDLSLTYGAIQGVGAGIFIVTSSTIVLAYFEKYRGIAMGIMDVGETCSSIVFPYLFLYVQDTYDFKGMMLIIGAIMMHTTAFTLALKEPKWATQLQNSDKRAMGSSSGNGARSENVPSEAPAETSSNITADAAKTTTGLSAALVNPMLYVLVVSSTIMHYSHMMFTTTIVDYGQDSGASLLRATSITVYSSVTDLIGRLALPLLADRNYLRRSSLVMCCHVLLGMSLMLISYVSSFALLLLSSFCIIMCIACILTMKPVLMADYLGLKEISTGFGATGLMVLPLLLTAPQVVGHFRDFRGMYENFYKLLGGLNFFAGLLLFLVVCHEHFARSAK